MTRKEIIRNLKYTKEKHKNDKLFTFDTDISAMCSDVLDVLNRCVEIPDNATNGDVIKAMFGVREVDMSNTYCVRFPEEEDYCHYFFKGWWNAPYKKGGKDDKI